MIARAGVALVSTFTLAACLDPLVSDEPRPGTAVLPAGSIVPALSDEELVAIGANDGVDGQLARRTAFANGAAIKVWDFGPAPVFAAPVFMLVRRTGPEVFERVGHNTIVDSVPGDAGYSPFWAAYFVVVTDRYAGEIIPSVAAIDEAVERGLVERPETQPFSVNCPIVGPGVTLEVGGSTAPLAPPSTFYVKGHTVPYYDFGRMPLVDLVTVPETRRYVLHREGEEPLSEPIRNVDMTGDGDILDSNDILDLPAADPAPSASCRTVTVAVPAATDSIDTTGDQTMADLTRATQLFNPDPVSPIVIGFQVTTELRNCPVQKLEGQL